MKPKTPRPRNLTFHQASNAMTLGKQLSRSSWPVTDWVQVSADGWIGKFVDGVSGFYYPTAEDLVASDWQVVS